MVKGWEGLWKVQNSSPDEDKKLTYQRKKKTDISLISTQRKMET